MRRHCIIFVIVAPLTAIAGCSAFSRFGPAAQPVVPPPTTMVVPPPGSIPLESVPPGGIAGPPGSLPPGAAGPVTIVPNSSVLVPALNRDYVWDQVVDVVNDYFDIDQEVRLKLIGNVPTEGTIETFPLTGATLFEPWRRDSVGFDERLESTLQSIRRTCSVRVIPQDGYGYLVDVVVNKELEIVDRPLKASAGAATFRYDTSLQRDTEFDPDPHRIPGDPARPIGPRSATNGWKFLGRDTLLEQKMLGEITARLGALSSATGTTVTGGPVVVPSNAQPPFGTPGLIAPTPAHYPPVDGVFGNSGTQELPQP